MYAKLIITPHREDGESMKLWPGNARSDIIAACMGSEVPSEFFGHNKQRLLAHCVLDAPPPVIIDSTAAGGYRITALGKEGVDLLYGNAATVYSRLVQHLGVLCTFKRVSGLCTLKSSDDAVIYSIRRLVVARKIKQIEKVRSQPRGRIDFDSVRPLIRKAIINGLLSQASYLDDSGPINCLADFPADESIEIDVLKGDVVFDPVTRPESGTRPINALVVTNLVFSINIRLQGPWYCGHVRSKGYGLIQQERIHARA